MSLAKQFWFLQQRNSRLPQLIPLLSALLMCCSSFLPWLRDPLGQVYSAWTLPIDAGWQFRLGIFNYGLLCLCCSIYACLVAWASWKPFKGSQYFQHTYIFAGILCLLPVVIFLLQYLCTDVRDIDLLAQHKIQALLIAGHFGYHASPDLITIRPLNLDISTIGSRAILLIDQVGLGTILPLISAWILIDYRRLFSVPPGSLTVRKSRNHFVYIFFGILFLFFLRGPLGLVFEYQAKDALSSGAYTQTLTLLDMAVFLNPDLEQVAYYHRERGQALYYLHPDQPTDESLVYLAYAYRDQQDYLDAYQQLLAVWQTGNRSSWVTSELSFTISVLAEYTHPLRGPLIKRPLNDDTSLPWLQSLVQIDPSNVYGHYVIGRIDYDLHNYSDCLKQMMKVARMSSNPDILSAAYTYLGLSEIGEGNETEGRTLLFAATKFDPNYRNNVAREELSGLR